MDEHRKSLTLNYHNLPFTLMEINIRIITQITSLNILFKKIIILSLKKILCQTIYVTMFKDLQGISVLS
jgi:hypothetical protein